MRVLGDELNFSPQRIELAKTTRVIRIMLLDDQALIRAGICTLLQSWPGFEVIYQGTKSIESLTAAAREKPDIVLLELDLSVNGSGLDFLRQLRRCAEQARVIILTGARESQVRLRAIRVGAMGVVLKEKAAEELRKAIQKVHGGEVWLDRSLIATIVSEFAQGSNIAKRDCDNSETDRIASLTDREREIATALCQGLRNDQIANRLGITETTVRHHLTTIFSKTEVSNRFELMIFLYRNKFAKPPE